MSCQLVLSQPVLFAVVLLPSIGSVLLASFCLRYVTLFAAPSLLVPLCVLLLCLVKWLLFCLLVLLLFGGGCQCVGYAAVVLSFHRQFLRTASCSISVLLYYPCPLILLSCPLVLLYCLWLLALSTSSVVLPCCFVLAP